MKANVTLIKHKNTNATGATIKNKKKKKKIKKNNIYKSKTKRNKYRGVWIYNMCIHTQTHKYTTLPPPIHTNTHAFPNSGL